MSIPIAYTPQGFVGWGTHPWVKANQVPAKASGELIYGYRRKGEVEVRLYFEFTGPASSPYAKSGGLHCALEKLPPNSGGDLTVSPLSTAFQNRQLSHWLTTTSFSPGQTYSFGRHTITTLTLAELTHVASLNLTQVAMSDGILY